jgi:hypothetical protein
MKRYIPMGTMMRLGGFKDGRLYRKKGLNYDLKR